MTWENDVLTGVLCYSKQNANMHALETFTAHNKKFKFIANSLNAPTRAKPQS